MKLIDEVSGNLFVLNTLPGLHFSTIIKIKKIIYENSIDIIHTHNQGPQFYGSIAAKFAGKPVIHTKHGQNFSNSSRRDYLDRFSSFLTDIIVTVSDDSRQICNVRQKISQKKLVTVPNGVDTNSFYRFSKKILPQTNKPFVIGTVARLSPEKNHACLLVACAHLVDRHVDFRLNIVGDGPLRESLEDQCKELNLEKYVFFAGARNDIPAAMNELDLFVLPSLTEGISLTLLEAMSCELPVVATKVGGTPEVVVDGKTGFLVPSNDPVQLAEVIITCLNSPQSCLEMGRTGRDRVVATFSLVKVAEKYLSLYQELFSR